MKNENKSISFTTDQLKASLRNGTILADLHSACSALEQISAQILATSAPENVSKKLDIVQAIAHDIKDSIVNLVDSCIDLDKDLVISIEKESQN